MSKIVQAVNSMISNPNNITKVIQGNGEYFFTYKDQYKWSIRKGDDGHVIWFYPGEQSIEELASLENYQWDEINMVGYRDHEIGTREAKASFAELYTMIKERVFGVNKVLDDIISDSDPF